MRDELRLIFTGSLVRRNIIIALIVGTILNLINQGDVLILGAEMNLLKLSLTYLVPFCVASYGSYNSVRLLRRSADAKKK